MLRIMALDRLRVLNSTPCFFRHYIPWTTPSKLGPPPPVRAILVVKFPRSIDGEIHEKALAARNSHQPLFPCATDSNLLYTRQISGSSQTTRWYRPQPPLHIGRHPADN